MDSLIDKARLYDVVVVGGGPAGLTAAIYLARAQYRVLVVEKDCFGGQITITSEVVNYPGVPKTSGSELADSMRRQAEAFGAEFLLAEVERLSMEGEIKTVKTSRGELNCFGVLLATGARPRSVGFQGEEKFQGHGVAYCATCDGEFFTGKDVFVVGGGFAAAEESVFLTKFARHVTILVRRDDFSCAQSAAQHAKTNEKITVLTNTVAEEVAGDDGLTYLRYKNSKTGAVTEFRAAAGENLGVFVFAGYEPATDLVKGLADLNDQGYILTDRSQKTNVPGLYAAGDVCIKPLRQVVTAVGEGALAATELEKYAASMQTKTELLPQRTQKAASEANTVSSLRSASAANAANAAFDADVANNGGLFDQAMLDQLNRVFEQMQSTLILRLYLDERPISVDLRQYMQTLAGLTDKLTVELSEERIDDMPCVRIYGQDGVYTGLAFHGVPGGHEFTSFVLGLYNAAGSGQTIDPATEQAICGINEPVDMKALVALSCTMCPELVAAAQKIAALNKHITAEVYDLNHFPDLRDQYQVMSVPCLVMNGKDVTFGKKNIPQLLEWISQHMSA